MEENQEGIRGWELTNLDPEQFTTRIVEVYGFCGQCEYCFECASPCESVRELVPRRGKVVEIGRQEDETGDKSVYYALVMANKRVKYILMREPKHYWARAYYIPKEEVPASFLSEQPVVENFPGIKGAKGLPAGFFVEKQDVHTEETICA